MSEPGLSKLSLMEFPNSFLNDAPSLAHEVFCLSRGGNYVLGRYQIGLYYSDFLPYIYCREIRISPQWRVGGEKKT